MKVGSTRTDFRLFIFKNITFRIARIWQNSSAVHFSDMNIVHLVGLARVHPGVLRTPLSQVGFRNLQNFDLLSPL